MLGQTKLFNDFLHFSVPYQLFNRNFYYELQVFQESWLTKLNILNLNLSLHIDKILQATVM